MMTVVSHQWSVARISAFFIAFCAMLFALCFSVEAQQAKKMARVGYLCDWSSPPPTLAIFKAELRELGWLEGKQIEFEVPQTVLFRADRVIK